VGKRDRYIKPERGRDGRVRYWYFRRNGRRWRLPGEPGTGEFEARYQELLEATAPAAPTLGAHAPGTFGALVDDYFAAPEFKDRKPATQSMYRRVLEPIAKRIGHHAVRHIERRHVKAMRDEKADTPGMANMTVKVLRLVLAYAVDNDYIASTRH
jgi:hypothetical protein